MHGASPHRRRVGLQHSCCVLHETMGGLLEILESSRRVCEAQRSIQTSVCVCVSGFGWSLPTSLLEIIKELLFVQYDTVGQGGI